ncbi:MerR family transcriptional regulator [Pseudomonas oligotrophica]|uniref:MerR family transcriptional regulator n=1 Tax=Pseudomonas oligotrophica TaxID=2912055 RepID=UPI001F185B84|nr:MerR family transcriptional regulator [Pseudomonas oligotrophica]MCF7202569.1 MerR family transcriptional regulator [Pseudomonas oligotrophica]
MTETTGASIPASEAGQEELFPIREVCRLTGINPVTLRAWERRYGLIQPTRTESGHRLYSHADIEAVRNILAWTERGVAVSKVGGILARNAERQEPQAPSLAEVSGGDWAEWQGQVRAAVADFDEARLDQLYGQIFSTYPLATVFQDVLLPVWQALLLNQDGYGRTSEWLLLDAFLRARTLQRLQLGRIPGRPRVLVAAVPGQCRELELLVTGVLLGNDNLAVSVLPFGQPLDELALVCDKVRPQALVLVANLPPGEAQVRQFGKVALSVNCPVALAGEAAELGQDALRRTAIACLGNSGPLMQRRLLQFLAGQLDT